MPSVDGLSDKVPAKLIAHFDTCSCGTNQMKFLSRDLLMSSCHIITEGNENIMLI